MGYYIWQQKFAEISALARVGKTITEGESPDIDCLQKVLEQIEAVSNDMMFYQSKTSWGYKPEFIREDGNG